MDRNTLTGRLIPVVLLVASGAVSAAEVLPQPPSAANAARSAPASTVTVQQLKSRVGRNPASAATTLELTDDERERWSEETTTAASGKPLKIGALKTIGINVDLKPIDENAMTDQTYSFGDGLVRLVDGNSPGSSSSTSRLGGNTAAPGKHRAAGRRHPPCLRRRGQPA
jgi:lysyl endopeptidase